ncbi:MAG: DUF2889 domain-containing protein [Acidimicrobiia bacterium]
MPEADPEGPQPIQRRTLTYESWDDGDEFRIDARITDEQPAYGRLMHDMGFVVRVRKSDRVITSIEPHMEAHPHSECPSILPAFKQLEGVAVAKGFTREVTSRFTGPAGCAHLDQLARALGPVVTQAMIGLGMKARETGEGSAEETTSTYNRNTCHIWADGGVGQAKIKLGWLKTLHPNEYPAPPVAWFEEHAK